MFAQGVHSTSTSPERVLNERTRHTPLQSSGEVQVKCTPSAHTCTSPELVCLLWNESQPVDAPRARNSPEKDRWNQAMEGEMKSLKDNNVWELTALPPLAANMSYCIILYQSVPYCVSLYQSVSICIIQYAGNQTAGASKLSDEVAGQHKLELQPGQLECHPIAQSLPHTAKHRLGETRVCACD